jgi:hypothetical protein
MGQVRSAAAATACVERSGGVAAVVTAAAPSAAAAPPAAAAVSQHPAHTDSHTARRGDLLPGRRAGPRHTHTHARKQPQPRISTAIRTQTLHMRAHRQTHGGATYSLRCPRRRVEAYTHPRTHTAAPTHQHHPSGSSGGTSGAAVGRPTGAQHSRHSYSVAADSSQQGPATTSKAAAAGGGAADVPRTAVRCGGTFRRIHRDLLPYPYDCVRPYCTAQYSCTRVVATGMQQDTCHLYRPIDRLTIPAKKDINPE